MNFSFAERVSTLKPSAIRELLKTPDHPDFVSFAIGNPSPETFPVEDIQALSADILKSRTLEALQYGISEGYAPLREATRRRMSEKHGVGREFDECVIVSGGQQGIELSIKSLINENDVILCEAPSFIGALNAFHSFNARLIGVPMDGDGMDMEALERLLDVYPNTKMIYTIPTFQNPMGVTMSLARRKRLLELAEKYDVLILEDSPYFELRISGDYVPPIKSLDETGRVIFCGSFSKIVAPGIRVGYVIAHRDLAHKLLVGKQVSDVHTNMLWQMVVCDLMTKRDMDAHIEKCVSVYRRKRDLMVSALQQHCAGKLTWNHPDGGLFLWAELPDGVDSLPFCNRLKEEHVAAIPACHLYIDPSVKQSGIRLNFSLPTDEQIERGVAIMGRALDEFVR
ncbi:PLP-dependent aminotransferase family protein [Oscillospiraceae bacterium OttesenSCG-928-G22]|nr:PLP-dependent aminotransferase family protein [Oscillospiraceae bacterium OttesenSCG-928-G22]